MAVIYRIPTTAEISEIGPIKVAAASKGNLGASILPARNVDAAFVEWVQGDNYFGLQQLRGLGGAPSYVKPVGSNTYRYAPGYFGEFRMVDETELTLMSGSVNGGTLDLSARIMQMQDQLIAREQARIDYMRWILLTTGTFSITAPNGTVFTDTFTLQTPTATDWSTLATATPLKDLRDAKATLGVGKGLNFGAGSKLIMNSITANYLTGNANAADLKGKLTSGGNTLNMASDINRLFLGNGLPEVIEFDDGYYDDNNTFQYFVPTDKVVWVGSKANGEKIGEYLMTRHMINGGGTGSWEFVKDFVNGVNAPKEVPSRVEVYRGHNGGPTLAFPSAIAVLSV